MKKILIIEDDSSIAELERDYLEINDFECEIAARGTTGLEKALAENFDLIIIDIMLPGMDGYQICTEIRKKSNEGYQYRHRDWIDSGSFWNANNGITWNQLMPNARNIFIGEKYRYR